MKKYFINTLNKITLLTIAFLLTLILSKDNLEFKEKVTYYLYEDNFSFMSFKKIYNEYLGGIFFVNNDNKKSNTYMVFNSKLSYQELEPYNNGIKLKVINNYLVPNLENGIVIFKGKKDVYGNTIIIQSDDNLNIWYGNIQNISVNLYDYVEKGTYLGETLDEELYLVYSKGKDFLNYTNYFNY